MAGSSKTSGSSASGSGPSASGSGPSASGKAPAPTTPTYANNSLRPKGGKPVGGKKG